MNEKIKEIAVEAKIQMCSEERLQDFADRIIQKCFEIVSSNPNIGTSLAASRMKDYFYK